MGTLSLACFGRSKPIKPLDNLLEIAVLDKSIRSKEQEHTQTKRSWTNSPVYAEQFVEPKSIKQ